MHMNGSEKNAGQAQCSRVVMAMAIACCFPDREKDRARKHCSRMQCLEMRDGLRANADRYFKKADLQK